MIVIVVAMVVAVVLSSTHEYSDALIDGEYSEAIDGDITSEELCQEIKSNKRRILTMGARGKSQEDAHFYMLVTGGYMFKIPLSNLYVDVNINATSLTINQHYIRANEYLNVNASLFTQRYRFFLISNLEKDAFLGLMYRSLSRSSFQLLNLTSVVSPLQDHPQLIEVSFYDKIDVFGNIGIDSFSTYAFRLSNKKLKLNLLKMDNKADELIWEESLYVEKYMMDFYSNTPLVTVFYHKDNPNKEAGYYFFLDADGLITVTRRENAEESVYQGFGAVRSISELYSHRFEVKLSAFMVCDFQAAKSGTQSAPHSSPKQTTNATTQTGQPGTNHPYWAIALGIGTILVLGGIALYCRLRRHRKKKKNKNKKNKPRDDSALSSLGSSNISSNLNSSNLNSSNISSNASSSSCSSFALVSNPSSTTSSLASSTSSALQSVKSKIVSLLKGNKSKVAKAVTKEKNSKVKSKKPKSTK